MFFFSNNFFLVCANLSAVRIFTNCKATHFSSLSGAVDVADALSGSIVHQYHTPTSHASMACDNTLRQIHVSNALRQLHAPVRHGPKMISIDVLHFKSS